MARGLAQAFALPGCSRLALVGVCLWLGWTSTTPASRWADVPVDIETAAAPAVQDPVRGEVDALIGAQSWGDAAQRSRVARAVVEESRAAGFDPLLVMAVIQVESEAQAGAVSSAGARGLMQLRPPTLRFVASSEGLGKPAGDAALDDPALNVRLGVRYLHRLTKAFGNMGVALVAYNAGPHRVSGYLRARRPIPDSLRVYPRRVKAAYLRLVEQLGEGPAVADVGFPPSPEVALR
ncbi:MAG TPA: lytic transglycosylase domain-containing protein [Myxococcales bacterium]|nr:lytic transglycosylase domain-containing protein [Myxococcales bacterium]